jgi:hypothetical protein
VAGHETPAAADRQELVLSSGEPVRWRTRFAGLFLFLPLLARLGFSKIVDRAGYPGTKRIAVLRDRIGSLPSSDT